MCLFETHLNIFVRSRAALVASAAQLEMSAVKQTVLSMENMGFLLLHLLLRPYNTAADNTLETVSLTALAAITILLTARPQQDSSAPSTALTALLAVTVFPTAFGLALLVLYSRVRKFKESRAATAASELDFLPRWEKKQRIGVQGSVAEHDKPTQNNTIEHQQESPQRAVNDADDVDRGACTC